MGVSTGPLRRPDQRTTLRRSMPGSSYLELKRRQLASITTASGAGRDNQSVFRRPSNAAGIHNIHDVLDRGLRTDAARRCKRVGRATAAVWKLLNDVWLRARYVDGLRIQTAGEAAACA